MRLNGKGIILASFTVFCAFVIIVSCGRSNRARAHKDPYIVHTKAFLASPEGGGKKNALSNYVRAMEKFNPRTYQRHQRTFQQIIKNGCTGKEQNALKTLASVRPILKEVRRGNEKDFVRYPVIESWSSPIPDFLKLQLLGRLMVIQGLYCEYRNEPHEALEWYKHALIFGQRFCDADAILLPKVVSDAMEKAALQALQQFFTRQNLKQDTYLKIAEDLVRLRSSDISYSQAMKNENQIIYNYLKNMEVGSEEWEKLDSEDREKMNFIIANKESVLQQYKEFNQKLESLFQKDYPEIIKTDLAPLMAARPPHCEISPSSLRESYIREGITYAWWSLTITTAQACAYRAQKDTLLPNLAALSEIGVTPPKDPFSGYIPKYNFSANMATLYSIGPDLVDNGGKLEYDPTNGTLSAGDITVNVR